MINSSPRVIKNSALNVIGWVIPIGVTLFTIPFFINKLSEEGYGIWVLIGTVTGYLSLTQIGIGPAIIKYIAEFKAKQDSDSVVNIINASIVFSITTGVVFGAIFVFVTPILVSVFKIQEGLLIDSILSFRLGGALFFLYLLHNVYLAVFQGLQRYDISNLLSIIRTVLFAILSCFLLTQNFGIVGLVISNSFANLLTGIVGQVMVTKTVSDYKFTRRNLLFTLKNIFSYSIYSFVSQLASLLNSRLAEIVIGVLLGPTAVTYFNIPSRLVGLFSSGASSASSVLIPVASELEVEDNLLRTQILFLRFTQYFSFLIFPVYFVFIFYPKIVIGLWISADIATNSFSIMRLYSLAYLIAGMTVIPTQFLMGFGKVKFIAKFSFGIVIVSAIAYFPLIKLFGLAGAGYAVLLTQVLGILFIVYSLGVFNIPVLKYLGTNFFPCFSSFIAMGISKIVALFIPKTDLLPAYEIVNLLLFVLFYSAFILLFLYSKRKDLKISEFILLQKANDSLIKK